MLVVCLIAIECDYFEAGLLIRRIGSGATDKFNFQLRPQRPGPEEGSRRVRNYLLTLNMELTAIAPACGKQNLHQL